MFLRGGRHGVLAGFHVVLTDDLSQDCEEDVAVESEPEEIASPEPEVPAETIEVAQPEAQPDPV